MKLLFLDLEVYFTQLNNDKNILTLEFGKGGVFTLVYVVISIHLNIPVVFSEVYQVFRFLSIVFVAVNRSTEAEHRVPGPSSFRCYVYSS